jgi:hypothetical protein
MMTKEAMLAAMEEADAISKALEKVSNQFYGISDGGIMDRKHEVKRLKDIGCRMAADAARVSEAIVCAYKEAMETKRPE